MKRVLKWIGILFAGIILIIAIVAAGLITSTSRRLDRIYTVQAEEIAINNDAASLAIGQRWAEMHCQGCHGENLGGNPLFEDPMLGWVDAPNLTAGRGGIGATYGDSDWVRAIRHGIRQDGRSVFIMPSDNFYFLNDRDLAGIIAYLRTVPPVDQETRPRNLTTFGKILYAFGAFGNLLYAETIEHDVRPPAPPAGVTVEYGEYLASAHGCRSCHGAQLTGGHSSEPGAPFAPNLTPGGDLRKWSQADFVSTLRSGTTPSGYQLSEAMPWKGLGRMSDDELTALWFFLQNQPALPTTSQ